MIREYYNTIRAAESSQRNFSENSQENFSAESLRSQIEKHKEHARDLYEKGQEHINLGNSASTESERLRHYSKYHAASEKSTKLHMKIAAKEQHAKYLENPPPEEKSAHKEKYLSDPKNYRLREMREQIGLCDEIAKQGEPGYHLHQNSSKLASKLQKKGYTHVITPAGYGQEHKILFAKRGDDIHHSGEWK